MILFHVYFLSNFYVTYNNKTNQIILCSGNSCCELTNMSYSDFVKLYYNQHSLDIRNKVFVPNKLANDELRYHFDTYLQLNKRPRTQSECTYKESKRDKSISKQNKVVDYLYLECPNGNIKSTYEFFNLIDEDRQYEGLSSEIQKAYDPHMLPAKCRKAKTDKFKFKTTIQQNYVPDKRSDMELVFDIIKLLNKKVSKETYLSWCKSCSRDISIDEKHNDTQISNYKELVKNLITHYKKTGSLSYGDKNKVQEILSECERKVYPMKSNVENKNMSQGQRKIYADEGIELQSTNDKVQLSEECSQNNGQADTSQQIGQENVEINMLKVGKSTENFMVENLHYLLAGPKMLRYRNYVYQFKKLLWTHRKDEDIVKHKRFLDELFRKKESYLYNIRNRRLMYRILFERNSQGTYRPNKAMKRILKLEANIFTLQKEGDNYIDMPYIVLNTGKTSLNCLYDTGSRRSVLLYTSYLKIKKTYIKEEILNPPISAIGFTGRAENLFYSKILLKLHHSNISYEHEFLVLNPGQTYQSNIIGIDFINKFNCVVTHAFSHPKASLRMNVLADSALIPFIVRTKPNQDHSVFNTLETLNIPTKPEQTNNAELKESNIIISPTGAELFDGRNKFYEQIEILISTLQISNNSQIDVDDPFEQVEDSRYNSEELLDNENLQSSFNKQTLLSQTDSDLANVDISHLSDKQQKDINSLLLEFPESYARFPGDHGKFRLFQVSLNFMPGKTAIQPKRHLDFDKIAEEIEILERNGIIEENTSEEISYLCNLVIIPKGEKSTKADKYLQGRQLTKYSVGDSTHSNGDTNNTEGKVQLKFRPALDMVLINSITLGVKKVNLFNTKDLLSKIKGKHLSKFDLYGFFFSLELDSTSKNKINFYFKNKIYGFLRVIQGQSISVNIANIAIQMVFNMQTLKCFLNKYPHYKKYDCFNINSIDQILFVYIDDLLCYTDKELGWKDHYAVIHYVFWAIQTCGLKLSLKKCEIFVEKNVFFRYQH